MKYSDEQKSEIKEISDIAKNVHEPFRVKCFEVLLNHWASSCGLGQPKRKVDDAKDGQSTQSWQNLGHLSGALKAFMKNHEITHAHLDAILYMDNEGKVQFKETSTAKGKAGQVVDWTLLLALSNAITTNFFTVAPKDILNICKEQGCYSNHTWNALKSEKSKRLFSGSLVANGKTKNLTNMGQKSLADLIRQMAGGNS